LADRFAEAFAEYLHEVRKEIWGYAADEVLSTDDMIAETYKGIRPAPVILACPDQKPTIWKLLNVEEEIGVTLTNGTASVSGYYFGNPESKTRT
jgi:5-methyltetrahydrofolate--homocysteine methyltransferase